MRKTCMPVTTMGLHTSLEALQKKAELLMHAGKLSHPGGPQRVSTAWQSATERFTRQAQLSDCGDMDH